MTIHDCHDFHAFSALRRSDLRPATLRHHERRIDEAFRFIQGAFVAKLVGYIHQHSPQNFIAAPGLKAPCVLTDSGNPWRSTIAMIFMPFPRFVGPISAPPPFAITNVASMKHSLHPGRLCREARWLHPSTLAAKLHRGTRFESVDERICSSDSFAAACATARRC